MKEMCTDNRFEIIEKAKKHILEATNINTSEDEMKVLDSFLFRCWQMGWLDKYSSIEKRETHNEEDGYWVEEYLGYGDSRYKCSECGHIFGEEMIIDFKHNKYCADCGKKMGSIFHVGCRKEPIKR